MESSRKDKKIFILFYFCFEINFFPRIMFYGAMKTTYYSVNYINGRQK